VYGLMSGFSIQSSSLGGLHKLGVCWERAPLQDWALKPGPQFQPWSRCAPLTQLLQAWDTWFPCACCGWQAAHSCLSFLVFLHLVIFPVVPFSSCLPNMMFLMPHAGEKLTCHQPQLFLSVLSSFETSEASIYCSLKATC
jgi:hypothetical protein